MSTQSLELLGSGPPRNPGRPVRVLGIDLGTTNSTAAEIVWTPGQAEAPSGRCLEIDQPTREGTYTHTLVPSSVALYQGKTWVGEGAKRLRALGPSLHLEQARDLFYECKNDIGLRRTYAEAPPGFRTATEIAGHVLSFIAQASAAGHAYDRIVVTVPASFQLAQRQATREAARLAGFSMAPGDLLDEPVAAFLDYVMSHQAEMAAMVDTPRTLVVFDFGGGTCDVAVLRLAPSGPHGRIAISPAAVSRYHRLGGGDIDRAIVHDVLIPQVCAQNGLEPGQLDYRAKKDFLEPALIGIAESLKIGLCLEATRLQRFKQLEQRRSTLVKRSPGSFPCPIPGRDLLIRNPELSYETFDRLLDPFVDGDLLYARETEYRLTQSVFAPIQDALDRAGIERSAVNLCLLVGGSTLIPRVRSAVPTFFSKAQVLTLDGEAVQTAVARGAAYQALALEVFGSSPVRSVAFDDIAIQTSSGPVVLVPKGTSLPFPSSTAYRTHRGLTIPESALLGGAKLRVEITTGGSQPRPLFSQVWTIPDGVDKGDPLELDFRLTEDHVLEFQLRLAGAAGAAPFTGTIENPLTHVSNPQKVRLDIEKLEEELRTGQLPADLTPAEAFDQLAQLHGELNQNEKALECLRRALAASTAPDPGIVNRMAGVYGDMGNVAQEEKLYREAAALSPWTGPLFNLALARKRRGDLEKALEAIDEALGREQNGPYLTLKALIVGQLGRREERDRLARRAMVLFSDVHVAAEWELGWHEQCAIVVADGEAIARIRAERNRRAIPAASTAPDGLPPDVAPALTRPV